MRWPLCPSSTNHCGSLSPSTSNAEQQIHTNTQYWRGHSITLSMAFGSYTNANNAKTEELKFPSGCQGHHWSSHRPNHRRPRSCLHCQWRQCGRCGPRVANHLQMESSMSAFLPGTSDFFLHRKRLRPHSCSTDSSHDMKLYWNGRLLGEASTMRMYVIALYTLTPVKTEHLCDTKCGILEQPGCPSSTNHWGYLRENCCRPSLGQDIQHVHTSYETGRTLIDPGWVCHCRRCHQKSTSYCCCPTPLRVLHGLKEGCHSQRESSMLVPGNPWRLQSNQNWCARPAKF